MKELKESKLLKLKPKNISLKKIKHKKRIVVIVIAALVIGGTIAFCLRPKDTIISDYVELTKEDMVKNISVSGKIESGDKINVYSTLNNVVKEVKVQAGDKVNEGDILCVLDSSQLETEVSQSIKNIAIDKEKARLDMESKRQAYEDAVYLYNNNMDSSISDIEKSLEVAQIKLDDSQKDYDRKKILYENGAGSQADLDAAESNLQQCKSDYDKYSSDLKNAKVKAEQEIDNAKNQYESAVHEYKNNKEEISLQGKKDDIDKCIIKAPASGTITAVNTSVGTGAQGVLFTIENLDDPVVTVNVKEVDINKIMSGQEAEVTTDAAPDDEYASGSIISISDTINNGNNMPVSMNANQQNNNNSQTSASNTFEAKIKLDNPKENDYIKVGMNAKANIILEKRLDVFSISFSSILEEDDGTFIKVVKDNGSGKYEVCKVPVETGLETDTCVEIESSELNEGDKVLADPSRYQEGQVVLLGSNNGGADNE